MPLVLEYRGETSVPVEVEGVLPELVQSLSVDEVKRHQIYHGNQQIPLAEMFAVSGSGADGHMVFEGNLSGVHWIGAGMRSGNIEVRGPAGRHIGSEMTGGEIHVHGDASDWVGGEMHGGLIRVHGNAGHLIGAAYRGSARGMTGGTILIDGRAGNEIGLTMRRGLIAIGGDAGDVVGFNMIAGTVLVFGESGIRHGAGMRRGTIGLLGPNPPNMLPSFRRSHLARPEFLRIILLELCRKQFPFPGELLDTPLWMYSGDHIEMGRGEIFVPAAA